MTADEQKHIDKIGLLTFERALAAASLCVRMDARLTGLDKLRGPLAHAAALRATGFRCRPIYPRVMMAHMGAAQAIIDDLLPKAEAAARVSIESMVA